MSESNVTKNNNMHINHEDVQVVQMPIDEWIALPDHKMQRDTISHARKVVKEQLSTKFITHSQVTAVMYNGILYKADGHTRTHLWKTGKLTPVPSTLIVLIYSVDTLDEYNRLYFSIDNPDATELSAQSVNTLFKMVDTPNMHGFASAIQDITGIAFKKLHWSLQMYILNVCKPMNTFIREESGIEISRVNGTPFWVTVICSFIFNPMLAKEFWYAVGHPPLNQNDLQRPYTPLSAARLSIEESPNGLMYKTKHSEYNVNRFFTVLCRLRYFLLYCEEMQNFKSVKFADKRLAKRPRILSQLQLVKNTRKINRDMPDSTHKIYLTDRNIVTAFCKEHIWYGLTNCHNISNCPKRYDDLSSK